MILLFLVIEIFLLVLSSPVFGLVENKPSFPLGNYLKWRYSRTLSSSSLWKILSIFSIGFLSFLASQISQRDIEEKVLIWLSFSLILLGVSSALIGLLQSLTARRKPWYLRVWSFLLIYILQFGVFLFGLQTFLGDDEQINWVPKVVLILQGIEIFFFLLIVTVLLITWYLGRPYHQSLSESKTIETSQSHPFSIDFIQTKLSSTLPSITLGMSYLPGRQRGKLQRDLVIDIDRMKHHYQIEQVITLVPTEQLIEMRVTALEETLLSYEIQFLLFGWRDKWIPNEESIEELMNLIDKIVEMLHNGTHVLIHCMGGKGRTGLLVVSILMAMNLSLPQAIDLIRKSRKGCIHNPLQLHYLHWISNYIQRRGLNK